MIAHDRKRRPLVSVVYKETVQRDAFMYIVVYRLIITPNGCASDSRAGARWAEVSGMSCTSGMKYYIHKLSTA